MAIFRTDRERRMLGDRLIPLKDDFSKIHGALEEIHALFCQAHAAFIKALDAREREDNEDTMARRKRDAAAEAGGALYAWAHAQAPALLQPNWEAQADEETQQDLLERLFPLGPPSVVRKTNQLVLDGLTHLHSAQAREPLISFPAAFVADLDKGLGALSAAFSVVTVEKKETREAEQDHRKKRKRWDTCFTALRKITSGYLRLQDREQDLALLFTSLPERAAAGPGDTKKTPPAAPATPATPTTDA